MIPLPHDPNASHFWSLAPLVRPDWLLLLALVLLPFGGAVLGYWAGWWARGRDQANETAAGAQLSPADGAASAAAAPAPGAPVGRAGAPGVTPDFPWFDPRSVREAEQAAEVEAMVGGGR